jgi:hypothetical protein
MNEKNKMTDKKTKFSHVRRKIFEIKNFSLMSQQLQLLLETEIANNSFCVGNCYCYEII